MLKLFAIQSINPNPWQTRITEPGAEYIKELALDIAKNGLLQVPIGRIVDNFQVELAFGHNRLAAYRWLEDVKESSNLEGDWSNFPIEIRNLTDEQMANLAWSENEKRRDVTPIERAKAIQKRIDDFKWTNREAAEALGIDHSTISNILRLLKLPEILQKALQIGELTERQATALLVLYELPEFSENGWYRRTTIIQDALNGSPSDKIRQDVDRYIDSNGRKLGQAEFKISQLIPEGGAVYCGTCEACEKRFKNRNLCFMPACFEAKTEFVRQKYLEEASFISGYKILDAEKGGNPSSIRWNLEEIKLTKCPNLVLQYVQIPDKENQVAGFPHAQVVCEKRNNSCSCVAGLRANETKSRNEPEKTEEEPEEEAGVLEIDELSAEISRRENEIMQEINHPAPAATSAKDLEEAARQARRDKKDAIERRGEILKLVEARLVEALKEDAPGVFYLIAHESTYLGWKEGLDLEGAYHRIAKKLAGYPLVPSSAESLAELVRTINDGLARLELAPISLEKSLVEVLELEKSLVEVLEDSQVAEL